MIHVRTARLVLALICVLALTAAWGAALQSTPITAAAAKPKEDKERGNSEEHRNDDHQNQGNNGNNGNDGDDTGGDVGGGEEEVVESFMTLCHATGSTSNPYVEITVNEHAVPAHTEHGDFPMPAGGCPVGTSDTDEETDDGTEEGTDGDEGGEGETDGDTDGEDGDQEGDELDMGDEGWDAAKPFKVEVEVHKRQGVEVVKVDIDNDGDADIVVTKDRED